MSRVISRLLALAATAGALVVVGSYAAPPVAAAEAAEKPIVVAVLAEEKEPKKVAATLVHAKLDSVRVRDGADVVKALHAAGVKTTIEKATATEKGRAALLDKLAKLDAAKLDGVDAVIVVHVAGDKKGRAVTFDVVALHGGVGPSHVTTRVGWASSKKDDATLAAAVAGPLNEIHRSLRAPAKSADASSDAADAADAADRASASGAGEAGPSAGAKDDADGAEPPSVDDLLGGGDGSGDASDGGAPSGGKKKARRHDELVGIGVGAEMASRRFVYQNPGTSNLRPYDLPSAPGIAASLELTPFARTKVKAIEGLGLFGDVHLTVGTTSQIAASGSTGASEVRTKWTRFDAGMRWLVPLATTGVALGPLAAWSRDDFRLDDPSASDLPSVTYQSLRFGGLVRATLPSVELRLGAAWVRPLSAAPLTTRFRHSSVTGLELAASIAAPLTSHLELSLGVTFTRYSWTLRAEPGDAWIAGSASDELARALVQLSFRL